MNTFAALLDTLIAAPPKRRGEIERLIRETYGCRKAVLALDMSGFTLSVRRDGILSYLCQIRRMQRLSRPIVLAHDGEVVKYEADNLLAVFDEPLGAVDAALAMIEAAKREGEANAPPLGFSIGIDWGEILLLEHIDCFGDPVNLAHKLGEDIAGQGECLVTERVCGELTEPERYLLRPVPVSVSGLRITAHAVTMAPTAA